MLSVLSGLFLLSSLAAQAADRPNVVLVIWDTTRADHLSLYGYDRPTTPHLDQIASGGTVFDDAQSSAYWTLPSAASLFTGLFAHNHGVDYSPWQTRDYSLELPDKATTLAEVLKAQGYHTALFSASELISDNKSYSQGFDVYEQSSERKMVEQALGFIDQSGDGPWFTVLWFLNPHAPYEPDAEFDIWSAPDAPDANIRGCNNKVEWKDWYYSQCDVNSGKITLTDAQWDHLRALYDGEIRRNDTRLGVFWEQLQQRGLADKAVFVFTSDHGEAFGEHPSSLAWHNQPYFDNQTVPLVVRLPGKMPAKHVKSAVRTMDLYPTILELVGAPVPAPINAISLLPTVSGSAPDRANVGFNHGGMHYYRDSENKLIFVRKNEDHPFHRPELYRIQGDPREQHNVASDNPARAEKVHQRMMDFIEQTTIDIGQAGTVTDEQLELLKAMGYVE